MQINRKQYVAALSSAASALPKKHADPRHTMLVLDISAGLVVGSGSSMRIQSAVPADPSWGKPVFVRRELLEILGDLKPDTVDLSPPDGKRIAVKVKAGKHTSSVDAQLYAEKWAMDEVEGVEIPEAEREGTSAALSAALLATAGAAKIQGGDSAVVRVWPDACVALCGVQALYASRRAQVPGASLSGEPAVVLASDAHTLAEWLVAKGSLRRVRRTPKWLGFEAGDGDRTALSIAEGAIVIRSEMRAKLEAIEPQTQVRREALLEVAERAHAVGATMIRAVLAEDGILFRAENHMVGEYTDHVPGGVCQQHRGLGTLLNLHRFRAAVKATTEGSHLMVQVACGDGIGLKLADATEPTRAQAALAQITE